MGAFFLSLTGPSAEGDIANAIAQFRQQGFTVFEQIANRHFRLVYAQKQNLNTSSVYQQDADNFCVVTGTLLYRRRLGASAARLLFEDMRDQQLAPAELFGNYAVLCCIDGRLHVSNDAQGVYPLWFNSALTRISSSFLSLAYAEPKLTLNDQSVYEYVFQEAIFGGASLFNELGRLQVGQALEVANGKVSRVDALDSGQQGPDSRNREDHLAFVHQRLREQFEAIAACFGNEIDSALSGGYDSRLLLALMREQGLTPHLHVYGSETSPDVQVAKRICAGEGLELVHTDKSSQPRIEPDAFCEIVRDNFFSFQGHCADGIIDNGQDKATRKRRTENGRLQLNGGGGEVLRNFNYLPDRSYSVRQYLYSFYSRFDPRLCTGRFSSEAYYRQFGEKIKQCAGISDERLSRRDIEYLYAGFRCTYWMGYNNSINSQFGWFLTPFVDRSASLCTHDIPLQWKNHGRFEAELIQRIDPALAAYPSDYGHDFQSAPPGRRIIKDWLTMLRPPALRRLTYRLKGFDRSAWPYYLDERYIQALLPAGLSYTTAYFHANQANDQAVFRRMLTLEYLCQELNVSH